MFSDEMELSMNYNLSHGRIHWTRHLMTKKVLMSCHGTVFPQCNSRSLSFFLIWREKLLSKHFGVQFQLMLDVIKIQSEPQRNNIIEGWLKFWLKGHMQWRPRCLKCKWMRSCGTKILSTVSCDHKLVMQHGSWLRYIGAVVLAQW